MTVLRQACLDLIIDAYKDFLPAGRASEVTAETRLFGGDSPMDSAALVSLLIEVEQRVNDAYGAEIVIADDRAMSQKRSPFRTVGSLAEYVMELAGDSRETG